MTQLQVLPVVVARGSRTRLWPLSQPGYPEQFLALSGNHSLFHAAGGHLVGLAGGDVAVVDPLVVANAEHRLVMLDPEAANGDKKPLPTENQCTFIPLGEVHHPANPGPVPLEIIEVQSSSYLGEGGIMRFEHTYGRS